MKSSDALLSGLGHVFKSLIVTEIDSLIDIDIDIFQLFHIDNDF